ncbi:hypothetical protein AVEN_86420-1 [Araneus ventricosus]|uniref:Uncharacterized protein n=1 Tax=Araneus ventricosus TaxID=182803 RepID=A0A4Y2KTC3_ARAVE|nr:hypothetical protein AVEN_86420-1 [Araneus ventricosus]
MTADFILSKQLANWVSVSEILCKSSSISASHSVPHVIKQADFFFHLLQMYLRSSFGLDVSQEFLDDHKYFFRLKGVILYVVSSFVDRAKRGFRFNSTVQHFECL